MTIGQLARSVGVPDSTIRFYERSGLLRPAGRTAGNYRYYGPDAGDRLTFIRAAQAVGFELSDIKSMLAFQDGRVAPCAEGPQHTTRPGDSWVRSGRAAG